jgi:hypothetical protein
MTLFTASNQATVRDAAVCYFYEGLSVIPLTGKQCKIKWAVYQDEIALPQTIHHWHKTGLLSNVGIVCGAVSKNLVVMDLDGLAAIDAFERQFPYLLDTFTVLTGSGKGKHLYFRVDDLPPTTRITYPNHQGIELRANGCYVVAPPSLHPDTHAAYRTSSNGQLRTLPHLNGVKEWLYSQLARKNEPARKPIQRTIVKRDTPAWAASALNYECLDVQRAAEHNRNNQLNKSAYNLGQIVGDGHLSSGTVEQALLRAALQAGLSEQESIATIHSGMSKGIANPRSQQWSKRAK